MANCNNNQLTNGLLIKQKVCKNQTLLYQLKVNFKNFLNL